MIGKLINKRPGVSARVILWEMEPQMRLAFWVRSFPVIKLGVKILTCYIPPPPPPKSFFQLNANTFRVRSFTLKYKMRYCSIVRFYYYLLAAVVLTWNFHGVKLPQSVENAHDNAEASRARIRCNILILILCHKQ